MTRPLIQIGDEVREMTEAEFAQYEKDGVEVLRTKQEAEAKAAALASARTKLAALGLTEAEVAALLGD